MKSVSCLLAAGFFLLPAGWAAAEKPDIHTVMTAEEGQDAAASAAQIIKSASGLPGVRTRGSSAA
mgnify:CR=1 FL=1